MRCPPRPVIAACRAALLPSGWKLLGWRWWKDGRCRASRIGSTGTADRRCMTSFVSRGKNWQRSSGNSAFRHVTAPEGQGAQCSATQWWP